MYQGESALGAKPSCKARDAMFTSDAAFGSKAATFIPAVACTIREAGAISCKQLIRAFRLTVLSRFMRRKWRRSCPSRRNLRCSALRCVAWLARAQAPNKWRCSRSSEPIFCMVIAARSRSNLFKDVTTPGFRSLVTSLKEFDDGTGDLGH